MLKSTLLLLLSTFICISSASRARIAPRQLAEIDVPKPAFVSLVPNGEKFHVVISSFNGVPFSSDNVYYLPNYNLNSMPTVQTLNNEKLEWPNEVTYTEESIFNSIIDPYGGLIVAGGFLVPTKNHGGLFYYPFSTKDRSAINKNPPIVLTRVGDSWFYHRVRFVDMNGDGQKDLLTCRANKPIFGQTTYQLLALIFDWTETAFVEYVISNDGCDVFFDVADIDGDGRFEIFASGFFIQKLNIIFSNHPNNSFVDGDVVVDTIDTAAGNIFDVVVYDLDRRGNKELLVSNHQGNSDKIKGSLFFYSLTGNIRNATWTRNLIYDDFPVLKGGFNQAAPGAARLFHPNSNDTTSRPYIVLAGDGSEYAYIFRPTETDSLNYELLWKQLFKDDTVGGICTGDINNDGLTEIFIPIYEGNKVFVFSFAP
jgi:hypothetical protein